VSLSSVAHVGISTYSCEGAFILGAYFVVKTYSVCVLSRILQIPQIVRKFQPSYSNHGALCPFTIAPRLHASARVRIYIRIKSCKLIPDVNFQDSAPYASVGDMCEKAQIDESTWLM